jgi:hypothetical protein
MEANLAGKPKPIVQRALRALSAPLQEHWGDLKAFRAAAVPILLREGGAALSDRKEADALAEQTYRMVYRLRAVHFRALDNPVQVDTQYKALEQSAGVGPNATLRQASFWLAYRLQQAGLGYLRSPEGQNALVKCWAALERRRDFADKAMAEGASLTVDRIEAMIGQLLTESVTPALSSFSIQMLTGFLLEKARASVRTLPELEMLSASMPTQTREATVLAALSDPVRIGELNEARARFAKLTPEESTKRFDEFKLHLLRTITQLAPFAVLGIEKFSQAAEAVLYPYPAQLEWIRSFVKPIFTNAQQSTIFDDCATEQSVNQRYQAIRKAKRGNTVILELTRALAFTKTKAKAVEERQAFLTDLDLVKEFDWPTSLEQVTEYWAAKTGA